MREFIVIHPSRRCSNCDHEDSGNRYQCMQLVSMADGEPMPEGFACDEHQTPTEYQIELHRPACAVLGLA
jgi:hypothetical protein